MINSHHRVAIFIEVIEVKEIGLYIHIPFCKQKCAYCDFLSLSGREGDIRDYVTALTGEMKYWEAILKGYSIKSIFIGGGTPSLLPIVEIARIFDTINRSFQLQGTAEITLESNPGTLDKEKLAFYLSSGINRLSIGLQAWQNNLLRQLGRIHTSEEFAANYYMAREVGFQNINIDLMFGLPKQSMKDWIETINQIISLKPEHISAYSLKIEENTPYNTLYSQGKLSLPDEETERDMYHHTVNILAVHQYQHYEISNFSLAGKASVHNQIYWKNQEYIGLGLGAHSFFNKMRFSNTDNFYDYISKIQKNQSPILEKEKISKTEEMAETMFLGLRLMEGMDMDIFKKRFDISPMDFYREAVETLVNRGLLIIDKNMLRLTQRGIDLSNRVFVAFLPE
ncbi:MAG: radical SAM family heme chaperone HemW [Thermotaleaceae bacterium]